jgi:hypothetical protein
MLEIKTFIIEIEILGNCDINFDKIRIQFVETLCAA